MKVLAGVPSRLRNCASVVDTLAKVIDDVILVSQGATGNITAPNIHIIGKPVDIGMKAARNTIFEYAEGKGYDYILQSDDDLRYPPSVVTKMLQIMEDNPTLGGISSCPRVYFYWDKDIETYGKEFMLFHCPTQLWVLRTEAIKEVGYIDIEVLEDIEYGLRFWQAGWPLAKVHSGKEFVHNPIISRIGKGDDSGGQPESLRKMLMPESIAYIKEKHANLLHSFGFSTDPRRTYTARYNWSAMCEKAYERFGNSLDYKDNKGRSL